MIKEEQLNMSDEESGGLAISLKLGLKRLCDIVVSGLGMVIFSPVYVIIVLAIRLDSPGKAIFSQERIGKGGTPFEVQNDGAGRRE